MLFARQRTAWSLLASTSRSRPQENAHSRPGQRFEKDSSKAPCLEAYRKQAAAQRTAAYYREPRGKKKKADLNQRRRDQEAARRGQTPRRRTPAGKSASIQANSVILEHVRMVVSLIEGRQVKRRAILQMAAKNRRQHTMVRRRKIDQAVLWLNEHPP